MTRSEFDNCLLSGIFPHDGNILLKALFHDAKGDWEAAHDIAQSHDALYFMTIYMPICIEKKAMIGMRIIGIGVPKRRCRRILCRRNGSAWWCYLWGNLLKVGRLFGIVF